MSTKKTPSLASPLDAQEVKYRTPKSRKKERSVHDKELAEIAMQSYADARHIATDRSYKWIWVPAEHKDAWRSVARSVLEEAIYRVEAKINGK